MEVCNRLIVMIETRGGIVMMVMVRWQLMSRSHMESIMRGYTCPNDRCNEYLRA